MALDEILRLRQQPAAYLLLAYLREQNPGQEYFRLQPATIAATLGRTRKTIRTAARVLMDRGFIRKLDGSGRSYAFQNCSTVNKQGRNNPLSDIANSINLP